MEISEGNVSQQMAFLKFSRQARGERAHIPYATNEAGVKCVYKSALY